MALYKPGQAYTEGKIYAGQMEPVSEVKIYALAGQWSEPAAPPPATATLQVGQGLFSVGRLLLQANRPSTVTLQGPKDLLFQNLTIKLTALELVRNLAKEEWGSSRSITGDAEPKQEVLFAAPARVTAVGFRTNKALNGIVSVDYLQGPVAMAYVDNLEYFKDTIYPGGKKKPVTTSSGYHEQAVITHHLRFSLLHENADLLIASPSLPSRVGLALGDDTPVQLFPNEMELNGSVTSRDLSPSLNAAWHRGVTGETAEVKLRITSLTDGVVRLELGGTWGRSFAGKAVEVTLDSVNPVGLHEAWPFGPTVPDARASLRLTGRVEGGRRLALVSGPPQFQVRTTEALEVAQAFRIAAGPPPAAKRQVLAVWLMLPRLPTAAEQLELRLAAAAGDPAFPADTPLARLEAALPVDAAAYVAESGGYWYRLPLEKPVELDGTQAASPLFVVVAGREAGTLLAHRSLAVDADAVSSVPTGAGAGVGLVRNLSRTGQWSVQAFNRQAAQWLVDLELAPTPEEYGALLGFAYGAGSLQAIPVDGAGRIGLDTPAQTLAKPAGSGPVSVRLVSEIRAVLTAQLFLYRPVRS